MPVKHFNEANKMTGLTVQVDTEAQKNLNGTAGA